MTELQGDPVAQACVEELAEKCNQGQLTTEERQEYESYVHVGNLIGMLQAKARLYLQQHPVS